MKEGGRGKKRYWHGRVGGVLVLISVKSRAGRQEDSHGKACVGQDQALGWKLEELDKLQAGSC